MQLFTFFRRGFLGFRKRNKPHGIPVVAAIIVVNSLPETQEAPPKECKQLHTVESVWLEVLKSLILVLRFCVALLNLENLEKMTKQKCPSKTGFCDIKSKVGHQTGIGHSFCCSSLSCSCSLPIFCCLCGVLAR